MISSCLFLATFVFFGATAVPTAPVPRDAVRRVAADQIYSSTEQTGLRKFPAWEKKGTKEWISEILKAGDRNGASNVFLVHGNDIEEAIWPSYQVICEGYGAETAHSPDDSISPVWLVAYLGKHLINPEEWEVESVTVEGRQIRLKYGRPNGKEWRPSVQWLSPYYYWAPLPKLAPGVYSVELYDASEKAITLLRRVKVER